MHNGILKNKLTNIINTLISYSLTLLWLVGYNFINNYLLNLGVRHHRGISLGILIRILFCILLCFSILISVLNTKKIKYPLFLLYLIFSSYSLLPSYPFRWLYLSIGTVIFLLFLNNYITLLGEKKSLSFSVTTLMLIFLVFILLLAISFKFKFFFLNFSYFFIVYVFLGNIIVLVLSIIVIKISQFFHKFGNM